MSEEGYKNIIKTYEIETNELYEEIAKLKDILEKIRDEVTNLIVFCKRDICVDNTDLEYILQIIDKAIGE